MIRKLMLRCIFISKKISRVGNKENLCGSFYTNFTKNSTFCTLCTRTYLLMRDIFTRRISCENKLKEKNKIQILLILEVSN